MNKIKNLSKKSKIIVISIVAFVLLLIGGTFAWLEWSSEINALVNGRVCAPEIVFQGGNTINAYGLRPISNKENGLKKDISVNLENLCENDTATMDLYLDLEVFPTELAEESLVWELYKVTTENETEVLTLLNNGNFDGKTEGDTIELTADTEIVTSNISNYRLYIYIDGSFDNPNTMQNKSFKFNLYGEGRDAIYKEYVMKNLGLTQSTTYFINSSISKDTIESVDIVSFSNLPEGVIYVEDVSSNSDDSIKLYYLENPETNLKKVYLASSSGLIKMNTSMDYMFAGLTHVESLDLSRLDTSNVTSMVGVFYNSPSLTSINMSSWVTSRVTKMNDMFQGASGLISLDLSNFDTSKVTTMANMFKDCGTSELTININNFNTSLVTTMYEMFRNCKASSISLSNFSNNIVTSMKNMFYGCGNLVELNLTNFYIPKVTSMDLMFYGCSKLTSLDLSSFSSTLSPNMTAMFQNCGQLNKVIFGNIKTGNMDRMFYNCINLQELDLSTFDTSSTTSMSNMFAGCTALETLDLSTFNTEKVTNMQQMFYDCENLKYINLSGFNTSIVTSMNNMFGRCYSLTELDLSSFTAEKLTNITEMFASFWDTNSRMMKFTKIDISGLDFTGITSYANTFRKVSTDVEIIVKDCTQYNKFVELFGNSYTNLHTVNNDNCTV